MAGESGDFGRSLSRRKFIKGGAIVTAVMWANPRLTGLAGAEVERAPRRLAVDDGSIAAVGLLLRGRDKTLHRVAFRAPFPATTLTPSSPGVEFGPRFALSGAGAELHRGDSKVSEEPPPGVTARFDPATGALIVDTVTARGPRSRSGLVIVDYVLMCAGADHGLAAHPAGEDGRPLPPLSGKVVFTRCTADDRHLASLVG